MAWPRPQGGCIVAIFDKRKKTKLLQQLRDRSFRSEEEFQEILTRLLELGLEPEEVLWTLSQGSAALRQFGARVVMSAPTAHTADLLFAEAIGKHPHARRFILELLTQFPAEVLLGVLEAHLQDEDQEASKQALELLSALPMEISGRHLLDYLDTEDPESRKWVLRRLAQEPEYANRPRVKARLKELVNDHDPEIRALVFDIVVSLGGPDTIDYVFERFVHDPYPDVRERAAQHLAAWSQSGMGDVIRDRTVPLLQEGDPDLRKRAVQVLLTVPDVAGVLKEFFVTSQSVAGWIRERAIETLRWFEPYLIEPIIQLLEDEDQDVCISALMLARSFYDVRLVEPIMGLLKHPDWWISITAADILGNLADPRAVDALIEALSDDELKWTAIGSLAAIRDHSTIEHIVALLDDPTPEVRLEVVNALEQFDSPSTLEVLERCAKTDPDLDVRARAAAVYASIAAAHDAAEHDVDDSIDVMSLVDPDKLGELDGLLLEARMAKGSDVHVKVGVPPMIRMSGHLEIMDGHGALTAEDTERIILDALTQGQRARFEKQFHLDFCYVIPNVGRYRANVYRDRLGIGGVFRVIPNRIPTFEELNIPPVVKRILDFHQGLVVLSGPSSSGKSTTLAALVGLLNETKSYHILTLEDPIEFVHSFNKSLVNQRQVGKHTKSFAAALRAALREDPDVIVVGEMRDTETLRLALTAAGTGHLVIGTMHTPSADKTVDRIIESFPASEQPQIRVAMAESLKAVVCQHLLPKADGKGRVPAFEILFSSGSLANLIREHKTMMIESLIVMGRSMGMMTLDDSLMALLEQGLISPETAYGKAHDKEPFEEFLPDEMREEIQALKEALR